MWVAWLFITLTNAAFVCPSVSTHVTSKADRVVLGRKCKRVLDAGRADYLERHHLRTQLVHYCEEDDSIENCLLLAWRQEASGE